MLGVECGPVFVLVCEVTCVWQRDRDGQLAAGKSCSED